jgi:hypothetical protein
MHTIYVSDIMDEQEEKIISLFFSGDAMDKSFCSICNCLKHVQDPITHAILIMATCQVQVQPLQTLVTRHTNLACQVQIQLSQTGLQPFKNKDVIVSYHDMDSKQKSFLDELLRRDDRFISIFYFIFTCI